MADATLDNCGNCRYWDRNDKNLLAEQRRDGLGVCRIMSYPDDFKNLVAFVEPVDPPRAEAVVLTATEFFCNLYKVGK